MVKLILIKTVFKSCLCTLISTEEEEPPKANRSEKKKKKSVSAFDVQSCLLCLNSIEEITEEEEPIVADRSKKKKERNSKCFWCTIMCIMS